MARTSNKTRRAVHALCGGLLKGSGLLVGDLLPCERTQAARFGISRSTVRRVLRELEEHDVIERRQGQGTFLRRIPDKTTVRQVMKVFDSPGTVDWPFEEIELRAAAARTYNIAVMNSWVGFTPQVQQFVGGIFEYAQKRGHRTIVEGCREPGPVGARKPFTKGFRHPQADGMILFDTIFRADLPELEALSIPYIVNSQTPTHNTMVIDLERCLRRVFHDLVGRGFRDIAVFSPVITEPFISIQLECELAQRMYPQSRIRFEPHPRPVEVLEQYKDAEALVITDDVYGSEICRHLDASGRRIGQDIEVVCHVNRGIEVGLPPRIGRMEFDLFRFGRLIVQRLEEMLDAGEGISSPIAVSARYIPSEESRKESTSESCGIEDNFLVSHVS